MKSNFFFKAAAGAVMLSLLYLLYDYLFLSSGTTGGLAWGLLSNFLITLILSYYALHSRYRGGMLILTVFVLYFLIGHFNLLVEALVFNVTSRSETLREMLKGLVISSAFAPLLVRLFSGKELPSGQDFVARSYWSWSWRIMLANIIYLLFYLTAGIVLTLVYPDILNFYEGKIPPMDVMIETQLFLRGFVFAFVAILVLRTLNVSMVYKAVFIGLLFAIIGGVAQLIPPNDLMPGFVRVGHGFEVGISNFLFGIAISFLLRQHQTESHAVTQRIEGQQAHIDVVRNRS